MQRVLKSIVRGVVIKHVAVVSQSRQRPSSRPSGWFMWSRNFSSQAGRNSGDKVDDLEDGFSDLEVLPEADKKDVELTSDESSDDDAVDAISLLELDADAKSEKEPMKKASQCPLLKVMLEAPRNSVSGALKKWFNAGNTIDRSDVFLAILNLLKRRFFFIALQVAERTGVSAVWPGWGHASENSELPDGLTAKGIVFLGPPSSSMNALGDRVGSALIAQAAGVPTLPWSGSQVEIPLELCLDSIPEQMYRNDCVTTAEKAVASCQMIGYLAMIKASWGGGGKGIRNVNDDDEVRALFKQVQGGVPGSPIFIMRLTSQSGHLEVQLLCDQYGNVVALHSRDCSVQWRHQKIIEEGPVTVAPQGTVKELEQAARRLAKAVGYVGAATVEYLYSMETGEYYFLELNPRLQVEHPVTEWIAEVNLPAAQVAVGMGIPLWQVPEIMRFYGMDHGGGHDIWRKPAALATPFIFDEVDFEWPKGHCVAVRITNEDPDDGFKPTGGKVKEISLKASQMFGPTSQ